MPHWDTRRDGMGLVYKFQQGTKRGAMHSDLALWSEVFEFCPTSSCIVTFTLSALKMNTNSMEFLNPELIRRGLFIVIDRNRRPFSLLAPRLHKHKSDELMKCRLGCVDFRGLIPPSSSTILLSHSDLARGDLTQRADESFMLWPCRYRSPPLASINWHWRPLK